MIKLAGETEKGPLFILGLSHANLDRMRAGQPVKVDLTELGYSGDVVIFTGETEESMAEEMRELIGPKTVVKGWPE